MPRPLRLGRGNRSTEKEQADEPRSDSRSLMFTDDVTPEEVGFRNNNFPVSTFTGDLRPEPAETPRTDGSGGLSLLPCPSLARAVPQEAVEFSSTGIPSRAFTGTVTPRAIELPRILEVGGFLYQRIEPNVRGDLTMILNGHPREPNSASIPLLHQHQDHLPHLDHGYSQCWLPSGVQLNDNFTGEVQRTERNLNQVQQNIESDLATAQELRTEIQQLSLALSASQVPSYGSMSTDVQLAHSRSAQSTARKPKRKSKILRELEPHDETPEPELERLSETLQPTHTDSAQPVLPKPKYDSKMLRELEDHNKSPESASESEQAKPQHETTRSKPQPNSPKSCRKSLMLREIEAHNRSPEPQSELDMAMICALKNDWRDVTLTRSARKDLVSFVKDKPPTPRKNLNLDTLMLAELNGMDRGRKTFHTESSDNHGPSSYRKQQNLRKEVSFGDEEEDEEEDLPKDIKTNGRSIPQPMPTRRTIPWQAERSIRNNQQNQKLAAEFAWRTWDNRKGRINGLVKSPRYNPNPSQQEMGEQGRKKPAYHATAEIPDGFEGAFHVDKGLYVFSPTLAAFSDFGRYLKDVEEIAGRKMGVVKVIVPSEWSSRTPNPSRSRLNRPPLMEINEVSMSLNEGAAEEPSKIYNILITNDSISVGPDYWLDLIQADKDHIVKKRAISLEAISRNDVWRESHMLKSYTERRMIRHSKKQDMHCALNQPATPILRAAFNCRNPNIDNLLGNRFASSQSTQPGINESVFHIAGGPGPLSSLQMNKYAAYSIKYHHSGAPRISTVTLPEHHAKLEKVMHITQDSGNLFGRPSKPPICSQFVAHKPMYVPHATLSTYDVDCTEVVQHQGEMVITFPYAYHQAYVSGPNITEEILYASDRCKVFHRENLYHHCNPNCTAGQPEDFDLKGVFSNTLSSTRSGPRQRSGLRSPSIFLSPRQSPGGTTSQERDVEGRPSKRTSGLKAMDHVSDDGDRIDPSAQLSRSQPSARTHRKATRLTSNPHKPDMWDPAHAFGGSPDPADNNDGSPIGGIRPRDPVTGRLLKPHDWRIFKRKSGNESDDTPRKHSRRH